MICTIAIDIFFFVIKISVFETLILPAQFYLSATHTIMCDKNATGDAFSFINIDDDNNIGNNNNFK